LNFLRLQNSQRLKRFTTMENIWPTLVYFIPLVIVRIRLFMVLHFYPTFYSRFLFSPETRRSRVRSIQHQQFSRNRNTSQKMCLQRNKSRENFTLNTDV
jgi:hypothetical protein